MALPTIATPTYTLKVPSTNKTISYRPFLVKEEKVLLMALESENEMDMAKAMKSAIHSCVNTEGFDVNEMALFDMEYIFLNIRAKSVGEVAEPSVECKKCKEEIKFSVDLTKVKVKKDRKHKKDIKLTDKIGVMMRYPDIDTVAKYEPKVDDSGATAEGESAVDSLFAMIRDSIDTIWDGEELHSTKDYTAEEVETFLNSIDSTNFAKIQNFFETMPKLEHTVKYKCEKCEEEGETTLTGLQDFFF